ncbi:MAG: DUF4832 domain-containing protein [Bacteroidales bacterium]|nr:DUF4832 domain-containing protein [Bacteroidales bacterium]
MKNYILSVVFLFFFLGAFGQTTTQITYQEDHGNILNPGRGFYHAVAAINYDDLLSYRKEGISLVFISYSLSNYKNGLISASFLHNLEHDFATLRNAGMKAIIRFSYTDKDTSPYGDASPAIVLKHIQQLKPILKTNSDVILVLQAGFIGAWGEWYYTDYYSESPGVVSDNNWADRRQLVDSLLAAMPKNRMVQVRTPEYKIKLLNLNSYTPVSPAQAYSEVPIARIAHHNDCFVSGPFDEGTYTDSTVQKPYLAQDTRFTIMGGETCNKCAQSVCSNALEELRRFHWTFLNLDYNTSILSEWKDEGCFPKVWQKLGYRFRLVSADIQNQSKPGGEVNLKLKLLNDGWANPTNPRNVEIILKNKNTGKQYYVSPQGDMRLWPINDTIYLNIKAGLPENIIAGDYDFYLNLPDGDTRLMNRPEYSIRLANTGIWDSVSGYNALNATLNVSSTAAANSYYGRNYFKEIDSLPSAQQKIIIDGDSNDWSNIPVLYSADQSSANKLKIFNTTDTLFILVQGNRLNKSSMFLFDADNDSTTGSFYTPWKHSGFDYLLKNDTLYSYDGTDHNWQWKYISKIVMNQDTNIIELKIPFDQMSNPDLANQFTIGFINPFSGSSDTSYLPLSGESPISFTKKVLADKPAALIVKNYEINNIVYWTKNSQSPDVYTILQRADDTGSFKTIGVFRNDDISYIDQGLKNNQQYQYRVQYQEGNQYSAFSDTVNTATGTNNQIFANIKLDGSSGDWDIVPPTATGLVNDSIATIRFFNHDDSLFIDIQASQEKTYQLYFNSGGTTGYNYIISNDSLYSLSENNRNFDGMVFSYHGKNFVEMGLRMVKLDLDSVTGFNVALVVNGHNVWGEKSSFYYLKYPETEEPQNFTLQALSEYTYSRIKLSWSRNSDINGYFIERSVGDSLHFKSLVYLDKSAVQYIDKNLDSLTPYYYRMCAYQGITRSDYTPAKGMKPGQPLGVNDLQKHTASVIIRPNPVLSSAEIEIFLNTPDNVTATLYSINGQDIAKLYGGEILQNKTIVFNKNGISPGYYILRIKGQKTSIYKKLIIY